MLNKNAPISFTVWLPKNARHATQIGLVLPSVCSLPDSCWYEQITLSTKFVELLCLLSFQAKFIELPSTVSCTNGLCMLGGVGIKALQKNF